MDIEYGFGYEDLDVWSYVENRDVKYGSPSKGIEKVNVPILTINELLRRYNFLYDNAGIILGQLINEAKMRNLSIGERLASNVNININENNKALDEDNDIFVLLEEFLLGDRNVEDTDFYSLIMKIKFEKDLFKYTRKQFVNEDVKDFNVRVILEFVSFMIEQQKGCYICSGSKDNRLYDSEGYVRVVTISDIKEKLKMLRPYFDIVLYENRENGRWNGKRRIWSDRRDEFEVGYTLVDYNDFNKYFCNPKKDDFDNIVFIPEKAIQSIYCQHHEELPWNMKAKCCDDDSFERPKNTSCCGREFFVNEENMFVVGENSYHLCSECGYIVKVDVSDKIFERISKRCSEDSTYLRKKMLYSELINIDREDSVKSLVKRPNN